jgi:hypothetical protein
MADVPPVTPFHAAFTRAFVVYDDSPVVTSIPLSTTLLVVSFGVKIPVKFTDKVRLQHCDVTAIESTRKVQLFGALAVGLSFFDSTQTIIDNLSFGSINVSTPDATVVPVDQMVVSGQDTDFLPVVGALFGGTKFPAFVSAFGLANVHNSDAAAAHNLQLSIVSAIEILPG